MTLDEIRKILPTLPEAPGCYKYIGQEGNIIYVGKAKNLRRRVSSYFQRDVPSSKTRLLVRQIRRSSSVTNPSPVSVSSAALPTMARCASVRIPTSGWRTPPWR